MYNDILENVDYSGLLTELETKMKKIQEKESNYQQMTYLEINRITDYKKQELYKKKYFETYDLFVKPLLDEAEKYRFSFSKSKSALTIEQQLKELSNFLRKRGYTTTDLIGLVPTKEQDIQHGSK